MSWERVAQSFSAERWQEYRPEPRRILNQMPTPKELLLSLGSSLCVDVCLFFFAVIGQVVLQLLCRTCPTIGTIVDISPVPQEFGCVCTSGTRRARQKSLVLGDRGPSVSRRPGSEH